MKEIISLRKPREKHYLNDDGTITLYAYDYDVHYLKNGTYEEIKNSLIEKEGYIQNEANSFEIQFLKNHPQKILKITEEENYLEYSLLNKNIETELWHDQNSVIFFDVLKNIDLQYTIQNNKLKDYITLKDKNANLEDLVFAINSNLEFVLNDENIEVKKDNQIIYFIEKPTLMDKDKNYYPIHYKLEKQEENYYLSFIVEKEILEKEELYPLVIDPMIMNNRVESSFEAWISSLYPDTELGDMEFAKIGGDENSINRALLKFPLPEINPSYNIINATVFLSNWVVQEELNKNRQIINVHEVTAEWDEYLATWNQMHDKYKKKVSSFFYPKLNQSSNHETVTYSSFDLTKLVKEWYGGKQNNGILLKSNNETYTENVFPYRFNTKEYDANHQTTYRPYLLITYKIQGGLVPYMNYNEVGHKNGTSYINTFNGNVVSIFDIIDTISKKLPIGLQVVYNSCEYNKVENSDFGAGWKLNYDQEIIEEIIDSEKYLKYITDSNAIHYFYFHEELNLYKDEDGINATIKQEENKYILTLKNGYQYHFEKISNRYKLTKIIDNANNQCIIGYDNENKITSITDGEGQTVSITYKNSSSESFEKITKTVEFETKEKRSQLNFLGTKLQSITTKFGTTHFIYENNKIASIYDNILGMRKSFSYDHNSGRVAKVTEYGNNNLEGKSFHYSYGANLTKVTDHLGKINILLFDESGKLVNQYTKINENALLKDTFGFRREFFNDLSNKEIKNSTIPQKHIENLLINSSFENNTEYNFNFTNAIVVNENAKIGLHCLKLDSFQTSSITYDIPQNNKYTISFDFKYEGLEDVLFNLYSLNENQKIKKCSNSFSGYKNNFEYVRVSFDGEFHQNDQLILEITSKEQNKYSYLDNIQIEVGEVSNIYNLVDNSSFNFGINCWNISGSDFQGNELANPYQFESLNGREKAITLLGNVEGSVAMTQHFNVTGKKGDIYHISFWYKSEGLTEADGTFGNMVNLQFFNIDPESGQGTHNLPLNPNVNEWQYFSASIIAENDYSSFSLNFISGMEPNGLSITHIMLNKDLAQLNYDYDSEGNLISYTDLSNENYQYEYDENNQLIASFDRQGRNFSYEYDNVIKDRLLKSISREGISNEIKYNDYGNPTKTIINNVNVDGEIKTNHYYHIRLKGTDKYINYDYFKKSMILKSDDCNHTIFKIVKIEDDYAIQLQENYLTFDRDIYLSTILEEKSLLCLGKLNNGSYTISLKNEPSRYLTYENGTLILKNNSEAKSENNQQFYFEDINTDLFIENKAEYTRDGKYLLKRIDALDKVTLFDIDPNTGLTKSIIDSKNNKTTYTYDSKENITKMKCDQIEVSYEYNQDELLTKISTDNQDYRFTYDEFLNTKEVKVGENLLISNEYLSNNGDISKSTYANGHMIKYDYDEWERIKSKEKDNKKYNYIYDNLGNLSKIISDTEKYQYYYDYAMRICSYQFNDFEIDYQYENNNIISKKFKFLKNNDMTYSYNKDDSIIKLNFLSHTLNYKYDYLGRLTNKDIDGKIPIEYEYYTNGKKTSFILKSMKIDNELYKYIYDDSYNIIKILLNNSIINDYTYDIHNELISERNYQTNRKYEYCYDNFGNILNKKTIDLETGNLLKEDTYEYLNNNWKDQLTKFNDISISYDEIGNPTTIGNKNLSWKNGRELKKITDSNLEVTYDYDINGIRTIKNVNGKITNYFTENNHIIYEQKENNMLYYIRDEKNRLLGFKYNEDLYFYQKNNQEDIIGIYDSTYHLIATYVYDSWGKILNIKDSSGNEITDPSHIAIINPFRYRSYYYDEETKLYYLNARYYNPEWGRFLNADSIIGAKGKIINYNLYDYCENNPINKIDSNGQFALAITGIIGIGLGISAATKALLGMVTVATVTTMAICYTQTAVKARDRAIAENKNIGNHNVYVLVDPNKKTSYGNKVEYVGRTTNLKARAEQHSRNDYKKDLVMYIVAKDTTREVARGTEQGLIEYYQTLNRGNYRNNQINGVNPNRKEAYDRYRGRMIDYFGNETYVGGIEW